MRVMDALTMYQSRPEEETALAVAAEAQAQGLDVWFWYDARADEPLKVVIDLPSGCICLPVAVLHERPEGIIPKWEERMPEIAASLCLRGIR